MSSAVLLDMVDKFPLLLQQAGAPYTLDNLLNSREHEVLLRQLKLTLEKYGFPIMRLYIKDLPQRIKLIRGIVEPSLSAFPQDHAFCRVAIQMTSIIEDACTNARDISALVKNPNSGDTAMDKWVGQKALPITQMVADRFLNKPWASARDAKQEFIKSGVMSQLLDSIETLPVENIKKKITPSTRPHIEMLIGLPVVIFRNNNVDAAITQRYMAAFHEKFGLKPNVSNECLIVIGKFLASKGFTRDQTSLCLNVLSDLLTLNYKDRAAATQLANKMCQTLLHIVPYNDMKNMFIDARRTIAPVRAAIATLGLDNMLRNAINPEMITRGKNAVLENVSNPETAWLYNQGHALLMEVIYPGVGAAPPSATTKTKKKRRKQG